MISIGFLNDSFAFGNAIHTFFSSAKEFEVLFETKSEEELPSLMQLHKLDYLVLTQVPKEIISVMIRIDFPEVKVIFLGYSHHHILLPYHEGYYYFFIPRGDVDGIKSLSWFLGNKHATQTKQLKNRHGLDPRKLLTRKEREVIGKLYLRNDRKLLSDELNRELDTINKHVTNSLRKTKCHKLEELFDWIEEFENKGSQLSLSSGNSI
jgi:hypothetical protein